jgi:hypothetical protein
VDFLSLFNKFEYNAQSAIDEMLKGKERIKEKHSYKYEIIITVHTITA